MAPKTPVISEHPSIPWILRAFRVMTSCCWIPFKYDVSTGRFCPCGTAQLIIWNCALGITAAIQMVYSAASIWLFYSNNASNGNPNKLYAGLALRILPSLLTYFSSLFALHLSLNHDLIAQFLNLLMDHRNKLLDEGVPLEPDFKIFKKLYCIAIFRNTVDFLGTIKKPNRHQYAFSILPDVYKTSSAHFVFVVVNTVYTVLRLVAVFFVFAVLLLFIETMQTDMVFRTSKGKAYKPLQWRRCQILMNRQDQIFGTFIWPLLMGFLTTMLVIIIYSLVTFFQRIEFPLYAQFLSVLVAVLLLFKHILVPGIYLVSASSKLRREALLELVHDTIQPGIGKTGEVSMAYFRRFMRSVNVSGIKIGSYFILDRYACLGCVAIVLYYSITMFINFGH